MSSFMRNKYPLSVAAISLFAVLIFAGCATEQSYLENLKFVKDAVINYRENGNFHKDTDEAVNNAISKFDNLIPGEKSAVIFDIDETSLSNYPYNKQADFGYVEKYFDMWIDSAKAPAIPEVQRLYNYLVKRNFRIIFLTGRKTYQYDASLKNLEKVGYTKFDTLIVKDKKYYGLTALKFKSDKRTELEDAGYKIVGTVGDQWSDLEGPFHGIQVKIPNYQYFIK